MKLRTAALGSALVAAALATAAPASAAVSSLSSSGWDYQGSDVFTSQSKTFSSGGGNFKICLTADSKIGQYRLMEEDPFNPDDYVSENGHLEILFPSDFWGGCYTFHDLNRFRDGANNQAEFYVVKWTSGSSTVKAYD